MIYSPESINPLGGQTELTGTSVSESPEVLGASFHDILAQQLNPDTQGQVNEEQLFSALIYERLNTEKGMSVAEQYAAELELHGNAVGSNAIENNARTALSSLVDQDILSSEEAEEIHAQAFKAAQLDDNTEALYDSLGSRNDPTVAVTLVELAITKAQEQVTRFTSGAEDAGRLSLDLVSGSPASTSTASGSSEIQRNFVGGGGFLFKPVSESNGNLAVLLPKSMAGDVSGITLVDSQGNTIENEDSYGIYDDGRPLFRFNRPGSGYSTNLTVEVGLKGGGVKEYFIPNPSQRYE